MKISLFLAFAVIAIVLISGCLRTKRGTSNEVGSNYARSPGACRGDCIIPVSDHRFGTINFASNFPQFSGSVIESFDEIGVNFVRWNIKWEELEPERGVYDFDSFEEAIKPYLDSGIEILVMITTRNPDNCNPDYCRGKINDQRLQHAGFPPADYDSYYDFIYNFTRHFKGKISMIQVDNEVNDYGIYWHAPYYEYKNIVNTAYRAVKDADPAMPVVLAGFASPEWIMQKNETVFRMAEDVLANTSYDVVDIHFYHDYRSMPEKIRWFRDRGVKNLISTECSGPDPSTNTPEGWAEQPSEMVKRFTLGFSEGLQRINWFSFVDLLGEAQKFRYMGLVHVPYDELKRGNLGIVKKPAYYTYDMMTEKLAGFESVDRLDLGEGVFGFRFIVGDKTVMVAWTDRGERNVDISSHMPTSEIKITRIITAEGQTEPETHIAPAGNVTVSESPVFLEQLG